MKFITALLFSTLIIPGIAVCMDANYVQEDREGAIEQQRASAAQHEGHDRDKKKLAATEDGYLTGAPAKSVSVDHLIGSQVINQADDENIGTVADILIDQEGRPLAAVISVGGFLGIGEKDVALEWDQVEVLPNGEEGFMERTGEALTRAGQRAPADEDRADRADDADKQTPTDYVLAVNVSRDVLENAPAFERDNWR